MVLNELAEMERTIRGAIPTVPDIVQARYDKSDVVQESLVQVWMTHFRPRRNSPVTGTEATGGNRHLCAAYLRLVGRGQANNFRRRHLARRRQPAVEVNADAVNFLLIGEGSPDELVAREEERLALSRAIALLPAEEREAICRRYFGRETLAEIATSLGITIDQLRGRQERAVRLLRKKLGPVGPGR